MNLHHVDWSSLPSPVDDGGAAHLEGTRLPDVVLESTTCDRINLCVIALGLGARLVSNSGRRPTEVPGALQPVGDPGR